MNRGTSFTKRWEFFLAAMLVAEILIFGIFSPNFFNIGNLLYSTNDFAQFLMVSVPLTIVIIAGNIDISVGSMMGLASIAFGILWKYAGFPVWLAIAAALLVGALAGMLNGLLVAFTDINPLVITLGTMFLYQGLATGLSGSIGAADYNGIGGFPKAFGNLSYGAVGGIPYPLIFCVAFAIFVAVLLSKTALGRSCYLIGVNKNASLFSGIRVKKSMIATFVLSGVGSALAGIFLTSYFTSARSDLGSSALMPSLTAVVLGGTNINGGSGTVLGTFLAAIFLGYLKQGLMAVGVTSDVSQVTVGFILIATVVIKEITARTAQARLNKSALKKASSRNLSNASTAAPAGSGAQ